MRGRPRGELLAYALLTAVALGLRLVELGDRPFHHDESQDAYFSWVFWTSGDYSYQPILHGPLRFYLTAALYTVLGDSDVTARLAPALMGAAMVPLVALLRDQLGRVACLAAAALLTFGPSYLYFSRFAREDIYIACVTLALLAVTFRFIARPRRHHPALIGALLAASFATKESTFITVFVAGSFFLVVGARELLAARRGGRPPAEAPLAGAVLSVGWGAWAWAAAAFAAVFTLLFTVFLTDLPGLWAGVYDGLAYWLGQQPVGRGGEPWYFYLFVLVAEEWPTLLLGGLGAVVALRRPTLLTGFLVWAFVLSLAVYSWASEKFAWLVLHPLLPLVLLAGLGVQAIWAARTRPAGRAGLAAMAVGAVYLGAASWWVNAEHGADPREVLVSTQSSPEVKAVSQSIVDLDSRSSRPLSVVVDTAEGATFPYAWYLRDLPDVTYADLSVAPLPADTDVALMTEGSRERQAGRLADFDGREFRFRVWWVRDYGAQSPAGWARWLARREPWNATGGMPEWVYVRRGVS